MALTVKPEDQARFDNAASVEEINALHKELWSRYNSVDATLDDRLEFQNLSRAAFERFSGYFNPHLAEEGADDPSVVTSWKIRNWCVEEGIEVNAKGRISITIENQYRVAHELPERIVEVEEKSEYKFKANSTWTPKKEDTGPSEVSLMRAWGKANGFEVGLKGRLKPELIEAYKEANK